MSSNDIRDRLELTSILASREKATIEVYTLGQFSVRINGSEVNIKSWGRDKTIQLFQFLITTRHAKGLHREQIIDRLWGDQMSNDGLNNFKVAVHGINKVLEPSRKSRADAKYLKRQGATYFLDMEKCWVDADQMEALISLGNINSTIDPGLSSEAYRLALDLHNGTFLPNRVYEDWSSEERERLQILALGAYVALAEIELDKAPHEAIRLAQQALLIDPVWEDAYRIQMKAYFERGNRPQAIKTYQKCREVLLSEFGIEPLPETKQLLNLIRNEG